MESNKLNEYIALETKKSVSELLEYYEKDTKRKKVIFLKKQIIETEIFIADLQEMHSKQSKRKASAKYVFMYLGNLYTPNAIRTEQENLKMYKKVLLEIQKQK